MRQQPLYGAEQSLVGRASNVMPVEVFELGEIETGRRAADLRQIKCGDHFFNRKYFLIAVTPAEPHQVVAQRRRQIAQGAVGINAESAMPLRKLRAVWPVAQRHVRHDRYGPAERVVDLLLPRRV